jgi:hypothetical protein
MTRYENQIYYYSLFIPSSVHPNPCGMFINTQIPKQGKSNPGNNNDDHRKSCVRRDANHHNDRKQITGRRFKVQPLAGNGLADLKNLKKGHRFQREPQA